MIIQNFTLKICLKTTCIISSWIYVNINMHAKQLQIFTKHENHKIYLYIHGGMTMEVGSTYFTSNWIMFS